MANNQLKEYEAATAERNANTQSLDEATERQEIATPPPEQAPEKKAKGRWILAEVEDDGPIIPWTIEGKSSGTTEAASASKSNHGRASELRKE